MMIRTPANTTQAKSRRKIVWDKSNLRSVYSNISTVSATQEEISLLFGVSRVPEKGEDEVTVQATDRIVLPPAIAKGLAVALSDCIHYYESELGQIVEPQSPSVESREVIPPGQRSPSSKTELESEKARLLLELVTELKVGRIFERSFKLAEKALLGNRFLLGVNKKLVDEKPNERILAICKRVGMPKDLLEIFSRKIGNANYVYFGFEENDKTSTYKAYLESPEYWERISPKSPYGSEPFLLYEGFKWDTSDSHKRALTRYTCYPFMMVEKIFQRLSSLYEGCKSRDSLEIAKTILETALGRTGYENLVYLEVTEEDNPRKSFDINMYKANLLLEAILPPLLKMCRRFSIPVKRLHALFDPVRSEPFGHLSGGIDRDGKEFLTVYYGLERYGKGS